MARDGTATRERILDAAQGLVLERGFAGTSIDAVLDEASVTKGAFFHHFPSKDELGRVLLERYAATEEQTLDTMPFMSPLQTLSYAAACTERIRLGCVVFVTRCTARCTSPRI